MNYDECLERVNARLTRDYYYRGTSSWSRTYEIGQLRLVDKICFTAVDEMERFCFILVTVWPTLNSEAKVSRVLAQTFMRKLLWRMFTAMKWVLKSCPVISFTCYWHWPCNREPQSFSAISKPSCQNLAGKKLEVYK